MSTSAHTPEWEVYFCDINERPACVSVDLGFESLAPIPEQHTVFEVAVALQRPDADGFPADEEEWEQLEAIEEALVTAFQGSLQAVFVGKLLHDGRRNFYFYGAQEALPEVLATNVMQQFPAYTYATNTQQDKDWGLYLDFLFPEPADMQGIRNGRILRMMQEQGDEAHIPRTVTHKVSFGSETDRENFGKQVAGAGYALMGQGVESEAVATPYWLIISHVMPLSEESVHETTLYLWQLAETHQGSYDGWEAQVLREND